MTNIAFAIAVVFVAGASVWVIAWLTAHVLFESSKEGAYLFKPPYWPD